jgi:hypothetical protein
VYPRITTVVLLKLPIIDPLGILKEPAESVLRMIGADVELTDPFREFVLGMIDGAKEADESDESAKPESSPGEEREAYLKFGKKAITFDCSRCQAIAERVATEHAPGSPKKQLECVYYIKMFDENELGTDGYDAAKDWLEAHGLKDKLYAAYIAELGVES